MAEGRLAGRGELLEQAAARSRVGLRTRRDRIIGTARPILHTAVAATSAWLVATELVGHPNAVFAPIAAVITLGLAIGERRRRALEIALGVAVGIGMADAIIELIGTGAWQLGVVVALAMLAATLLGGGVLLASEAAVSAVLVATLQLPRDGFASFERFSDGLIGGVVALIVSSVLLPIDPIRLARAAALPLLERMADTLDRIAGALDTRDVNAAEGTLEAIGHLDDHIQGLFESLEAAGEAVSMRPTARGARRHLERYVIAAGELELAVDNLRAVARGSIRAINLEDSVPPQATEALHELAGAARSLISYLDGEPSDASREAAERAAGLANAVLEQTTNLSALHIVGQIRLAAVDMLRATGEERGRAQEAVRDAFRSPA